MDPRHRDRIAFMRVCSGRFRRDMMVLHAQTGKTVRLSSSHKLFGQDRETVDEAWPGDVIGLVGHDAFGIGDTLTEDRSILFDEIPRFPPEVFAYISNPNPSDSKKFRAGLDQLLQEGVVQSFTARSAPPGATLLAAVGPLQFEVVQWRLKSEYGAESRLVQTPWTVLRWIEPHPLARKSVRNHRRLRRQLRRRQARPAGRLVSERLDPALLRGEEPGSQASGAPP